MKQLLLALVSSTVVASNALAVPARPGVQEGMAAGSPFQFVNMGDEFFGWAETLDGHSLLMDADGSWRYARRNGRGGLLPSGLLFDPGSSVVDQASYHLRPNADWLRERRNALGAVQAFGPVGGEAQAPASCQFPA